MCRYILGFHVIKVNSSIINPNTLKPFSFFYWKTPGGIKDFFSTEFVVILRKWGEITHAHM